MYIRNNHIQQTLPPITVKNSREIESMGLQYDKLKKKHKQVTQKMKTREFTGRWQDILRHGEQKE